MDAEGRVACQVDRAPVQPAVVLLDRAAGIAITRDDLVRVVLQRAPYLPPVAGSEGGETGGPQRRADPGADAAGIAAAPERNRGHRQAILSISAGVQRHVGDV